MAQTPTCEVKNRLKSQRRLGQQEGGARTVARQTLHFPTDTQEEQV